MRGRRPALFSDSLADPTVIPLDRSEFEYHLETLTSRSEEAQFQRFAHGLLEVDVCPNLVPQTGPTGGGDSKVDTETYQVSDATAARWWSGTAREAAQEDWAFAISAKRDWRGKARSDVANVLASGRIYSRIHFVTNQFVRDKDRASVEKALTKQAAGIPVRIYDRSWIVQTVFEHGHWVVAEIELGLPGLRPSSPGTIGPRDADRARQLVHVDAELANPQRFANSRLQLAHAWLTSALLARGLGRAREEVDQRFDRAIDAAHRSGNARAERRMRYQKTWTAYWWFDDVPAVLGGYDTIEALLDDSTNAWDLEQLTNLCMLLHSAEVYGWLPNGSANLDVRRERLRARLAPLAKRRSHPTDAAWARTHLIQLRFFSDPGNPDVHVTVIKDLSALLAVVDHLPDYPVESLCDLISAYGWLPFDIAGLDQVADRACELVGLRAGAQAEARQLVKRAAHKVEKRAPEEAIRLIGRAWSKLHRQESRDLYVESAWIATQAYCDVGLFCAARAHVILALNRTWRSVFESAEVSFDSLSFALRLAWVELASGRLPLLLDALRIADVVAEALDLSDKSREAYFEERGHIEALLVRAIAASRPEDLDAIRVAPTLFREHQLPLAEQAALVLLGATEEAFLAMTGGTSLAQIQSKLLPDEVGMLDWSNGTSVTLRTQIMGCKFHATDIRTKEARSLVLALFAALEGFAATGFADHFVPMIDAVPVLVDDTSAERTVRIDVEEDDCGEPFVRVRYARGSLPTYAATASFIKHVSLGVVKIVGNVCAPGSRHDIERLFKVDAVQDRAFGLLHSCAMDDSTDASPNFRGLLSSVDLTPMHMTGEERFWKGATVARVSRVRRVSTGKPPFELAFNHQQTRLASVINMRQWDHARWSGVAVVRYPQSSTPYLQLIFQNAEAAIKIFRGLRRRIAFNDPDEVLRIAVLTGVDKKHPAHYRVAIAPALAAAFDGAAKTVILMHRMLTMTPETSVNLEMFLEFFRASGRFRLGAAEMPTATNRQAQPIGVEPIELRQLQIKPEWQVTENDPLFTLILQPEDDPFVPAEIDKPDELPVNRLLSWRREHRRDR